MINHYTEKIPFSKRENQQRSHTKKNVLKQYKKKNERKGRKKEMLTGDDSNFPSDDVTDHVTAMRGFLPRF